MKSSKCFIVAAVAVIVTAVSIASDAQAQGTNGGFVTVLDVAKVFKNYAPFDNQLKAIEGKAEQLRAQIQAQEQELRSKAQAIMQQFKVGSPERKQAEGDLEQQRASMMTEGRHAQTDLLNQEAKLYYDTYLQMQKVVDSYCQKAKIALVIRFESQAIDSQNRGDVIKGVNRNIVYQDRMDITVAIIKQMNAAAGLETPAQLK